MPPSPSMRISCRREMRAENHKRGRSLESGIFFQKKEDDLALFNEVQNKERESFLLQSNDDIDDILSTKLRNFSEYKHDLLNAEDDKNDYDWLITPPEAPLFPSLDDDAPPVNLARMGRPRSKPVSFSRSPSMEKGYRNGRSSASPHRLSPSPRSGNSTLELRSRPVSATPPKMRHPSPSRGLSPPPSKSSPAPRSSTPPSRRMSTGSRVRGTSPLPNLKGWPSNVPGFSLEAPPNLRTSLADRPASYVRGSSPASRNGRRSMSPAASRSIGLSHTHDRDPSSSHSKGSVASSRDDDVDSLQSVRFSIPERSAPRSISAYPGSRGISASKKPTNIWSSSAPKRSSDTMLQQTVGNFCFSAVEMDRKGPHNMFRPLLSSVPSSVVGKARTDHRSSITTSCNDRGTSGAHNTEENKQNQEDVTSDSVKGHYPDLDDELYVMDQADAIYEDFESKSLEDSLSGWHSEIDDPSLDRKHEYSDADATPDMVICSKCSLGLSSTELVKGGLQSCQECKSLEVNSTIKNLEKVIVGEHTKVESENGLLEVSDESALIQESLQVTYSGETRTDHFDKIANLSQNSYSDLSMAHVVKCRSLTASNNSYDEFSVTRDSLNSMRSSIEHSSTSLLSSLDLDFSRQTEIPLGLVPRCREDSFEVTASDRDKDEESICNDIESNIIFETASEISSHLTNVHSGDISTLHENDEKFTDNSKIFIQEEIDNADVVSADSLSDDDSNKFNSCMNEVRRNDITTATVEDSDISDPRHGVVEESRILLEDTGGTMARILTLDEATDAILFCSSIVHNLAYEVANVAIDNDTSHEEFSQPKLTFVGKSKSNGRDIHSRTTGKSSSKTEEAREMKMEIDTGSGSINDESDEKSSPRIVEAPNKGDSSNPLKLEAKCNCIIM
ncbi:hypothetical protein BUALT_Bualt05G0167600 [Buddleja alternifolia]|uniref:Uncharacterized protein n=1 Tax=Buddleja alternifolia TaxID=168488 RepID=A0AAV6XVL1_9LAMI|nr:hypothetical protein BUALT_Bualt05G0167600 [Buddleja alternifolia]